MIEFPVVDALSNIMRCLTQKKKKRKKKEGKKKTDNVFYIVFGLGEFRKDGKHREENRVENSVFHCLANERK